MSNLGMLMRVAAMGAIGASTGMRAWTGTLTTNGVHSETHYIGPPKKSRGKGKNHSKPSKRYGQSNSKYSPHYGAKESAKFCAKHPI